VTIKRSEQCSCGSTATNGVIFCNLIGLKFHNEVWVEGRCVLITQCPQLAQEVREREVKHDV
jgi:rRNA-processing protein FCF1